MATTSPPQKSEVTVPPVNTSSQASMEEVEGSLEGIPANISLITAIYSSRSASSLVDPSELQANANRAIDNMLHLKRSLDVKRQRATWELGAMLHQNEPQGATLIAAAKAICSHDGCPTITIDTLHCHGHHYCCWGHYSFWVSPLWLIPSSGPLLRSQGQNISLRFPWREGWIEQQRRWHLPIC